MCDVYMCACVFITVYMWGSEGTISRVSFLWGQNSSPQISEKSINHQTNFLTCLAHPNSGTKHQAVTFYILHLKVFQAYFQFLAVIEDMSKSNSLIYKYIDFADNS